MAAEIQNYNLQLQQVEVALLADPENKELPQLKNDLNEIISLTRDLINAQEASHKKSSYVVASAATDDINAAKKSINPTNIWNIGDKCAAKWNQNGVYYMATIENITESGEVMVIFDVYQNRSSTTLKELRAASSTENEMFPSNKRKRSNDKEYMKKKKQKKQQRMKDLDEERETDKNKWLDFKTKSTKKSDLFKTVKSIFATSKHENGRVGVGTCGVSGKPMTQFTRGESYKKGL